MTKDFPYILLDKHQIAEQINRLAATRIPFLFIIDYKATHGYVIKQAELDNEFVRFEIESASKPIDVTINWSVNPISMEDYRPKFDFVIDQIHKGNSFLTNLTQPTEVHTNLSLFDLFQFGSAKYKLWLKNQFVVLSPETFVRIQGRTISSFPMKGTIDASIENAAEMILNDPKEKAEHATIVDLIRNDLSLVAENVDVKRYRYIEKLTTNRQDLLQVSSEISGQLPENFYSRLGDILFALLPAGSITGAPKPKTMEIIEQAEGYDRGFYSGICGYFDGENLDSAVMIRFMEHECKQLIFKSGGGITSQSDLQKEYEELIQKVYVPIS
jgi:para-aminobenzoate synthetase component I